MSVSGPSTNGGWKARTRLLVDALFIQSRQEDRVLMRTVLIVSKVRSDGYREILGARIGDSEHFSTWEETWRWLDGQGLKGVFVVSDQHGGLREAVAKRFPDATRQRCQVHLRRKLLGNCSAKTHAEVSAAAKLVFQAAALCYVDLCYVENCYIV